MAFLSSETLRAKIEAESLILPFNAASIKHGAYELALGPETFVTSTPEGTKRILESGSQLRIPPGQFGLLMTAEKIKVPCDSIALISMRAGVKFQGLINVSGFHVDPGFEGQLIFSVYNAGSQPVVLDYGQRIFLIWYCYLDRETEDLYEGNKEYQTGISGKEVSAMQGEIASPGALKISFDKLKQDYTQRITSLEKEIILLRTIGAGLLVALILLLINLSVKTILEQKSDVTPSISSPPMVVSQPTPAIKPVPTSLSPAIR